MRDIRMFMNTLLETQYCLVLEDQGMAKAQNDCQSRNRLEQEQKVHDLSTVYSSSSWKSGPQH